MNKHCKLTNAVKCPKSKEVNGQFIAFGLVYCDYKGHVCSNRFVITVQLVRKTNKLHMCVVTVNPIKSKTPTYFIEIVSS